MWSDEEEQRKRTDNDLLLPINRGFHILWALSPQITSIRYSEPDYCSKTLKRRTY